MTVSVGVLGVMSVHWQTQRRIHVVVFGWSAGYVLTVVILAACAAIAISGGVEVIDHRLDCGAACWVAWLGCSAPLWGLGWILGCMAGLLV